MPRIFRILSLLPVLLLPLGLEAQGVRGTREPEAAALTPEARVFLGTLEAIRDFALEPRGDSVLWEQAIDGLLRELNDPYAAVLSPDEVRDFEEQSTGNYAGIGIAISPLNGAITITHVYPNTPADQVGLLVGDQIVGVGESTADRWTVDDTSVRIRGAAGTTVVVQIRREGFPNPIRYEIRREQVHIPAVVSERLSGNIGYVGLDRVTRNSAAEVDSVLTQLNGVRGLILDLRRNPGGYLDEALNLADLFLERNSVLVTTRSRTRFGDGEVREESARARLEPRVPTLPIVVLVDPFSASAAEIIAGALQDHDRALVLGERTFGKGTVQSVVPLPEGRLIRITSGEWFTPQGRSLNRPRDQEGHLIGADSIVEFRSRGGRPLLGGGGIFPDLEIREDTLSSAEQLFFARVTQAQIPLQQLVYEAGFAAAQLARSSGTLPEAFPEGGYTTFVAALVGAGLSETAITPAAEGYLRQRLGEELFRRLNRSDLFLEMRALRDPPLAAAIQFLRSADSQAELFSLAEAARARSEVTAQSGAPVLR